MNDTEPWVFLPEREPDPEKPPETAREVIRWWERRRLKYNLLVVGVYVACAFLAATLYPGYVKRTGALEEWPLVIVFRILYLIFIVIGSNSCYTCGWVSHLLVRIAFGDKASRSGPIAHGIGIVFSIAAILALFVPTIIQMISGTPPRHWPRSG